MNFRPSGFEAFDRIWQKGYLGVDLFFLLSGFVMYYVYSTKFSQTVDLRGYGRFLFLRLGRVYPVHAIILFGMISIETAKYISGVGHPFSLNPDYGIISNVLLVQSWHIHQNLTWNGPAWSISAEWAVYLICPWLFLTASKFNAALKLLTIGGLFVGLASLEAQSDRGLDFTTDFGVVRCFLEFSIGLLLACTYLRLRDSTVSSWLGSDTHVAGSVLAVVAAIILAGRDTWVVVTFCQLLLALGMNEHRARALLSAAPLIFLGEISYSFYMCHTFVFHYLGLALERLPSFGVPGVPAVVGLLLSLALTILIATLMFRCVELPTRSYVRSVLGSR